MSTYCFLFLFSYGHLRDYDFFSFRLTLKTDSHGVEWLADQWTKAGKPEINSSEWDEVVTKVGILTEDSVYR